MQTFMPFYNFKKVAAVLDNKRLGKQRVEAYQILNCLENGGAWSNHPIVKMWQGYEEALCMYGIEMCDEWISHGFKDSLKNKFEQYLHNNYEYFALSPTWVFDQRVNYSHQCNLLRKDPDFYASKFPDVFDVAQRYVWYDPVLEKYFFKTAEMKNREYLDS